MTDALKSRRFLLLVVIPLLLGLVGVVIYLSGGRYATTDNAYTKADVLSIRPRVAGAVAERLVAENDSVKAGQLMLVLDQKPYQVALAKAEAKLAEVRTNLAALHASYDEKQSELQLAMANRDYAITEQQRQANLATRKLVAKAAYDEVSHTRRVSDQQVITLERDLKRIAESLGGDADAPIEQHPSYRAAQAEVEQAQLNLDYTRITAPKDGIVTKPPEVGEFLAVGSAVMSLVASDNLWVEANFIETDLTHVRVGQTVKVHVDTYPDITWEGAVQSISPATGAEFSVIPAQNATGNWVKIAQRVPVRISIQPNQNAPALQAGLSTRIEIDTGYKRSLLGLSI
ncbi:HlyD family secretion protein [Cellvibrio sp. pealriver]|uniref:HlyD family secretion protein n=1 Tax=Cellvibrio sp. pealriver TaxID=1622269 RepID=UPI00066FE121|nr:HlyD family secretion protein [Cellvibrio sp. pealriver]